MLIGRSVSGTDAFDIVSEVLCLPPYDVESLLRFNSAVDAGARSREGTPAEPPAPLREGSVAVPPHRVVDRDMPRLDADRDRAALVLALAVSC